MNGRILLFASLILLLALPASVLAQSGGGYDLTWWTVDGGGAPLTGGEFALNGTLGQPDAGSLQSGPYTLVGGFWGPVAIAGPVQWAHHFYLPLVLRHN